MERRVDVLREQDGTGRQTERPYHYQQKELDPVGRSGLQVGNGRIEHTELLPLLTLLHALGELGFFVALQQRCVELASALVVPRQLFELLFAARHALDSSLIESDALSQPALLGLENLEFCL